MTQDSQMTFERISLYILAIIISPILFGIIFATYSLILQDSWSFGETVFVVTLYSFPLFAFTAFPVSLYIDFSLRIKNFPSWKKALLYACFGGIAGILGSIVLHDLVSILYMFLFGMAGGVMHCFILYLIKKVTK